MKFMISPSYFSPRPAGASPAPAAPLSPCWGFPERIVKPIPLLLKPFKSLCDFSSLTAGRSDARPAPFLKVLESIQ